MSYSGIKLSEVPYDKVVIGMEVMVLGQIATKVTKKDKRDFIQLENGKGITIHASHHNFNQDIVK
jgi:hypothetical protein